MPKKTEKHAIFDAQTPIFWTQTPRPDKMKELNKAIGGKPPQPHRWRSTKLMNNIKFIFCLLILHIGISAIGGILGIVLGIWDSPLSSYMAGAGMLGPIALTIALWLAKRKAQPRMLVFVSALLIFGVCVGLLFLLMFPAPPEGKLIFKPDIDTCFADGYSDAAFASVTIGMAASDVLALLGEPMSTQERSSWPYPGDAETLWWYSSDGACSWGDFAWRAPIVGIRDDVVVSKWTVWCYD